MNQRKIAILGSTGSIGTQALQIVDQYPERFDVVALSAHKNIVKLFEQVRKYRPEVAGITGISSDEFEIPADLSFCDWSFGEDALAHIAAGVSCDDILVSVVGMVGLPAVITARKVNKRVLLANKEALVAGGQLVMEQCSIWGENPDLIPVDSEHSAIYQCLQGSKKNPIDHIVLTASGGPFRTWVIEQMKKARPEDALKHPNWKMGKKISIDSATMFNKGLEIIEAKWLFNLKPKQIQVLVHPQSIVHSMVAYRDGSIIAQLGYPDMRTPIAYAMSFPERLANISTQMRAEECATLTFEQPDEIRFPALALARQALDAGGAACCMLNAANEIAVTAFLDRKIAFIQIAEIVEETLQRIGNLPVNSLAEVLDADRIARNEASFIINERSREGA